MANPDENKDEAAAETSSTAPDAAAESVAEAGATAGDEDKASSDGDTAGEGGAADASDDAEATAAPAAAGDVAKPAAGAKAPSPGARLAAQRAAKAAAKAAKRGKTKADEVEQKVEARAADVAGWLDKNRTLAYGAAAAVVLVIAGYVGWTMFGNRTAEQAAVALGEALDVVGTRLTDEPGADDDTSDDETFPSSTARAEKALELFRGVTSRYPGTDAAVWARLGEARELLDLGKPIEARAAYEKALREGSGDTAVAARAYEGIAFTFEAENEPAKAIEKFQALSRAGEGAYKDLADYHLARMYLRTNEETRAKELLRELVQRLRTRDDTEPGPVSPYVLAQAELRLAELDSSLVQRPTEGLGGGSMFGPGGIQIGGEGGPSNVTPEQIQEILRNLQKSQGGGGGAGGMPPGMPPGGGE